MLVGGLGVCVEGIDNARPPLLLGPPRLPLKLSSTPRASLTLVGPSPTPPLQFYDLLRIFELNGLPSEDNPYLFNGGCPGPGCGHTTP